MALNNKTIALEKGYFFYDVGKDRFIQLYDGFVFGRIDGNECFPADLLLSRQHLKITIENFEVFVEDLETTNRSKVNSNPLAAKEKKKLRSHDFIEMGNQRFVFTLTSLLVPPVPATPGLERAQEPAAAERKPARTRPETRAEKRPERLSSRAKPGAAARAARQERKGDRRERGTTGSSDRSGDRSGRGEVRVSWKKFARVSEWDGPLYAAAAVFAVFALLHLYLDAQGGGIGVERRHGLIGMGLRFGLMVAIAGGSGLFAGYWLGVRLRMGRVLRFAMVPALASAYMVGIVVLGVGTRYYAHLAENAIFFHCVTNPDSNRCQELIRQDYRAYYELPIETRGLIEQSLVAAAEGEPASDRSLASGNPGTPGAKGATTVPSQNAASNPAINPPPAHP